MNIYRKIYMLNGDKIRNNIFLKQKTFYFFTIDSLPSLQFDLPAFDYTQKQFFCDSPDQ